MLLAKSTRIIHQNQCLMTKFGRIMCLTVFGIHMTDVGRAGLS